MEIIGLLILFSMFVALIFVGLFIFAVRNGQFDDLDDPPERILHEEPATTAQCRRASPTRASDVW